MLIQILRPLLLIVGGCPIVFGLLISGILLGKPMACQDPPVCTPRRHGLETLLLALGPATSMACGYGLALLSRRCARANVSSTTPAVALTSQAHET